MRQSKHSTQRRYLSFYVDDIYVDPMKNTLYFPKEKVLLQPKLMSVLAYLASRPGEVISNDQLIQECWPDHFVGDNPVQKCIAQLRKALGDSPKEPRFIKTVSRKGYMLVARVSGELTEQNALAPSVQKAEPVWLGQCPYVGTRAYEYTDHPIFFGRQKELTELDKQIREASEQHLPQVIVHGCPQIGKSSFIKAGLLPHLMKIQPTGTLQFTFFLAQDLAETSVTDTADSLMTSLKENQILIPTIRAGRWNEHEKGGAGSNGTVSWGNETLVLAESLPFFIVFIDHLEQIALVSEEDLQPLQSILDTLTSAPQCLLIMASSRPTTRLKTSPENTLCFSLPQIGRNQKNDIIKKSAELAGLIFDYNNASRNYLNETLLEDIQQTDAPIGTLQHMLFSLYAHKEGNTLTFNHYDQKGGVSGFYAELAEESFSVLTNHEQTLFMEHLFCLVTLNPRGDTVALNKNSEGMPLQTDPKVWVLFLKLAANNILKIRYSESSIQVCFWEESILKEWPRLNQWVEQNISTLYLRHDLLIMTDRWLYHQKAKEYVVGSGRFLKQIKAVSNDKLLTISEDENAFISSLTDKINTQKRGKTLSLLLVTLFVMSLTWLSINFYHTSQTLQKSRNNAENLISFMLYDLKEKLIPLGKLELLDMVANRSIDYFDAEGLEKLSDSSLLQWAESFQILGEVYFNKLDYQQANQYFNQSLKALQQAQVKSGDNSQLLMSTMLAHYWVGEVAFRMYNYELTQFHWQLYLDFANQLRQLEPDNATWLLEQSHALNNLGALAEKQNNLIQAEKYLLRSIAMKQQLLEQSSDKKFKVSLMNTLSWMATLYEKSGKLKIASEYYQQAHKIVKELIAIYPDNFRYLGRLTLLEQNLAKNFYYRGELKDAEIHAMHSISIINQLLNNDTSHFEYRERLVYSYLVLGKIQWRSENYIASQQSLYQAQKYIQQLSEINSDRTDYWRYLSLLEQANLFLKTSQTENALFYQQQAYEFYQKYYKNDDESIKYFFMLLLFYEQNTAIPNTYSMFFEQKLTKLQNELLVQLGMGEVNHKFLAVYCFVQKSAPLAPKASLIELCSKVKYVNYDL